MRNMLNHDFKYEDDKLYKIDKRSKKWSCLNNNKPDSHGYIQITINRRDYLLHRLIYLYHNPEWDIHNISKYNQIDHDNRIKSNNKIENLRIIDHSGNNRNKDKRPNSSSIYKGVSWDKRQNKWRAQISINGKTKNLGCFEDENEAVLMYQTVYDEIMEQYC
tara:strand:+ start:57 stop:542 length:486 start_codon:yes stop_codon:yes gene_type:complete